MATTSNSLPFLILKRLVVLATTTLLGCGELSPSAISADAEFDAVRPKMLQPIEVTSGDESAAVAPDPLSKQTISTVHPRLKVTLAIRILGSP
jgi:hypothetical protein